MKTTSEYITLLRKYMAENASKYGIMRMGIFGSVARGEQTVQAELDVCVELQTPNMFSLVHIKEELHKDSQGPFCMANASKRPIRIQLVIIRPTYTESCTLTS